MKKALLFLLAYFVITMAWAYPWHMLLFHDQYVAWGAFQRDEPIMLLGIAAIVTQGLVIGYLYPFYNRGGGSHILRAIRFNLIIGLMTYSAMGFATAAKFQIEPVLPFLAYHTLFQIIQFTLTGTALGMIFGKPQTVD
ncbi:MAG: hypothetical protein JAY67_21095 [Candidatus Thiodiazotropha taylori]|nr:hypothetical protein [Candidatus Thiodiazotropha taylori]MCG7928025.1 hypothetical protein [Candidatus Thiodiazotropha taylori]MCG7970431.1 hypothetical protein [Candidatus Thiodiazotropha taylori]MCG8070118.1 hypothetical protein [Candidatus Thiodiazotropha taylori]